MISIGSLEDEFSGRTAIVTGAGAGIGETVAERLVAGGANVVLASRNGESALSVAKRIDPEGKRTLVIETDVRDPEQVQKSVEATVERFGGLQLAVNNAGITGPHEVPTTDLDINVWRNVIDTDLNGIFYSLKYEIPAMAASGGGAIVNMSAVSGVAGIAGLSAYTAAKHGIIGLTRTVALEVAGDGVRVNAVAPGYVATPRVCEASDAVLETMAEAHPLGRLAKREEVAELVAYLLSDRAAFTTGAVHMIDGGYTSR